MFDPQLFATPHGGDAKVVADGELDFSHVIAGQAVDRIAGHVVGIDTADLVYEQSRLRAGDLEERSVRRSAGRC